MESAVLRKEEYGFTNFLVDMTPGVNAVSSWMDAGESCGWIR